MALNGLVTIAKVEHWADDEEEREFHGVGIPALSPLSSSPAQLGSVMSLGCPQSCVLCPATWHARTPKLGRHHLPG